MLLTPVHIFFQIFFLRTMIFSRRLPPHDHFPDLRISLYASSRFASHMLYPPSSSLNRVVFSLECFSSQYSSFFFRHDSFSECFLQRIFFPSQYFPPQCFSFCFPHGFFPKCFRHHICLPFRMFPIIVFFHLRICSY